MTKTIEQITKERDDLDAAYLASERAREQLRTEVEFTRRVLANPGTMKPLDVITWAEEKLAEALLIDPTK